MTRKEALAGLIEKVEAGEDLVWHNFWPVSPRENVILGKARQAHEGSLDAAKELHEAVLTGWWWKVIHPDPSYAQVGMQGIGDYSAETKDPARAWLIVILHALYAQETD